MRLFSSEKFWLGYGRSSLIIFTIYALLTILLTWPTAVQLGSHIPGQLGDAYVHLWTFEWLKNALLSGQNLFETNLIFYPVGVSLLNHNIAWINFALWLPLQALFGSEAGYSLAFMLIFPLNGVALYLLVREVIRQETAAFIGGLVGAFWPYNLSHYDHPNLILIAWLPLALLYLLRLKRNNRWQDAALAGLFIALIGLTRWQLLLMATPMLGLFLLWLLLQNNRREAVSFFKQLCVLASIAVLLMLPLLLPLFLYQLNQPDLQQLIVAENRYPTDLAAYFIPGSYHPLWQEVVRPLTINFTGNYIYVRSIGYVVLFLVGIGLLKRWALTRIWALLAAVYLLLALGSSLHLAGNPTIPLPYRLIEDSFLIQTLRFPDRFNVLLVIPISLLAAWGVDALTKLRRFPKYKVTVPFLLCGLILFEYANEFQMLPLATPQWLVGQAANKEEFAILDIPAFNDEAYNKQYMRYQLVHQKPIVAGRVARPPQAAMQFVEELPLLQNLLTSQMPPTDLANHSQQISQLAAANVEYIVLHRQFLSPEEELAWQDWFLRPSHYEDESIIVYRTNPLIVGEDLTFTHSLLEDDNSEDIGLLKATIAEQARAGDWITLQAVWGAILPLQETVSVCLGVENIDNQISQEHCQPLSTDWPTNLWEANEIVRTNYQIQLDPFAPAGIYSVTLQLEDMQQNAIGHPAIIGEITVEAIPRRFTPTVSQNQQAAIWQETLRLHGFDLEQSSEELALTLHWQAISRPEKSYKFFVHLIETSSGELVAQTDFVPRSWTYPTNWWEAGEHVADTAVLPLNSVGSGTFQLQVGIYDPDSGERLLVTTENNASTDALILTEIIRP